MNENISPQHLTELCVSNEATERILQENPDFSFIGAPRNRKIDQLLPQVKSVAKVTSYELADLLRKNGRHEAWIAIAYLPFEKKFIAIQLD